MKQMSNFSEYGKLDYQTVLMMYAQSVSMQLLKLPHEVMDTNLSAPVGQTYVQIIQSYCDSVVQFEMLLKPYHTEEYHSEVSALDKTDNFKFSQAKFGALITLCDQKGLLLQTIATNTDIEDDPYGPTNQ